MDILKSSNIERVIFDLFGAKRTKELMESLSKNNYFEHSEAELAILKQYFSATYSDDNYGLKTIKSFVDDGYLMDPHTATCIKGYEEFSKKDFKTVIYSTAEWTKFSPTVLNAINQDKIKYSDKEALEQISNNLKVEIPKSINNLFSSKILHKSIINVDQLENEISKFL